MRFSYPPPPPQLRGSRAARALPGAFPRASKRSGARRATSNVGAATPDNLAQARNFFDRALAADPDNVDALIASAVADAGEGASSFVADPMAAFAAAEAKLTKALSLVPDHAGGHMWLGVVEIFTKRAAQGIAEC